MGGGGGSLSEWLHPKKIPVSQSTYPFPGQLNCRSTMETHAEKKYTFNAGAQLMAGRGYTAQNRGDNWRARAQGNTPFDASKVQV